MNVKLKAFEKTEHSNRTAVADDGLIVGAASFRYVRVTTTGWHIYNIYTIDKLVVMVSVFVP